VHFGNVESVSGNFVSHKVIWEEINGCIGNDRFAEYIDFKFGRLLNYEKLKGAYTSVTFVCGIELYVSVYLVYVFVDEVGVCSFGVVNDLDVIHLSCVEYYVNVL
jgi:hypothetical protein